MLFDYLKAITVTKNCELPLEEYTPFLITRWLTFGAYEFTPALNETVNVLGNLEKDKHFKLLLTLYPATKRHIKFNYIKKKKKETTKEEEQQNKLLADSLQISLREINERKELVEFLKKQQ
jgi:hypothetical protein